jgi:hypothetical protein
LLLRQLSNWVFNRFRIYGNLSRVAQLRHASSEDPRAELLSPTYSLEYKLLDVLLAIRRSDRKNRLIDSAWGPDGESNNKAQMSISGICTKRLMGTIL